MSPGDPMLHLICGKIAAGKSTLAASLARAPGRVLISEDAWLAALFSDQMSDGADYLRCSARLRAAMGPHVVALLRAGVSVVMDYPANTPDQRAWMRGIFEEAGCAHVLHLLVPPDDVCLARLRARNESGAHPFSVSEEMFHRFAAHFTPPAPSEGFTIRRYDDAR